MNPGFFFVVVLHRLFFLWWFEEHRCAILSLPRLTVKVCEKPNERERDASGRLGLQERRLDQTHQRKAFLLSLTLSLFYYINSTITIIIMDNNNNKKEETLLVYTCIVPV